MPSTYLDLTNRLLVKLREVKIPIGDLASVRNVQELAKNSINSSISMINMQEKEWPFNSNSVLGSQVCVVGQEEYDFPFATKDIDWYSFHLVADDTLLTSGRHLEFISRDSRNRYLKNIDDLAGTDGRGQPLYVYPKQNDGFGLSPSPDKTYTVTFEYFKYPTELINEDDEPLIPSLFDEVILQGAAYHLYMSRDNTQQAQEAYSQFKKGIDYMRTVLINKTDRLESTLINRRKPKGSLSVNDYFL